MHTFGMHIRCMRSTTKCATTALMKNSWAKQTLGQTDEWTNGWKDERKIECQDTRNKNKTKTKMGKKGEATLQNFKHVNLQLMLKWNNHVYLVLCMCVLQKRKHRTTHPYKLTDTHTHTHQADTICWETEREGARWMATTKIYKYLLKYKIRLAHARVLIKRKSKQNRNRMAKPSFCPFNGSE